VDWYNSTTVQRLRAQGSGLRAGSGEQRAGGKGHIRSKVTQFRVSGSEKGRRGEESRETP